MTLTVCCAGDRFITPAALGQACRDVLADDVDVVEYQTAWPDIAFGDVDGVREASGDPGELKRAVSGADVLVTHLAPVTEAVIAAADALKVVGVTRGGPVNVDLDAASAAGVPVIYLPGRNLDAVAEFTIGVMITLPRGIAASSRALAAGRWDARFFRLDETGPELGRSTIGLVGLGAVGRRVAGLASAFGARVVGFDPFVADVPGVESMPLADVLAGSDFVSLHLRLTDDTRGMFGAAEFAAMRRGAYLVNTARGELVQQDALDESIASGHLGGAALDVFDPEPPLAHDPLLARDNVLATPHLAGASRDVALTSAQRIARAVADYLESGRLADCANPAYRR